MTLIFELATFVALAIYSGPLVPKTFGTQFNPYTASFRVRSNVLNVGPSILLLQ